MSRYLLATAVALSLSLSLSAQPAPPKRGDPKSHAAGQGEDIRGTMTLQEISQKTGVPVAHFRQALKLDKTTDLNKPVREWIHANGMTMQDVRDAVKSYKPAGK